MAVLVMVVCGAGFSLQTAPAGDKSSASTTEGLRAAFVGVPASAKIAAVVAPAAGGAAHFERNADMPLKPASVMKLFTTSAALVRLGPDFVFETRAFIDGDELIVIGAGDPGLGDERLASRRNQSVTAALEQWAAALAARGVTRLKRIVLDDSIFDQEFRHPDWPVAQAASWYQAPVGGLNINDNCVDIRVRAKGKRTVFETLPPLPDSFVENAAKVGGKTRIAVTRDVDADVFRVTGVVAGTSQAEAVTVRRPTVIFGYALKSILEQHGVQVESDIVRRTVTPAALARATPLGVWRTPLPDVLWRCNTFSQNMFAECLAKSLAAYDADGGRSGVPGSWTGGVAAIRATLERIGVKLDGFEQRDGSGLSHENRASAADIVNLLQSMYRHSTRDVFLDSLARAGEEGSMRKRYAGFRGKLIGKTGTLDGVHALAGYMTRDDGVVLAFAILINGPGGGDLPDKLCRAMLR